MNQLQFTVEDCKSPERIERLFRRLNIVLQQAQTPQASPFDLNTLATQIAPLISKQLEAPGAAPLNLQSLLPDSGQGVVLQDTHANRLTLFPAVNHDVGTLFWETDRTALYVVLNSSGTLVWRYVSGTYYAVFASRPSDLGANDANFRFVDSTADTQAQWMWTGTEWVTIAYLQEVEDVATNAVSTLMILRHLSTGTPAAGFGGRLLAQLEDASNQTENASALDTTWTTATSGSETSDWTVLLRNAGAALAKAFRVYAGGAVEMIAKIKLYNNAAPTNGQLLIGDTAGAEFDAATLTAGQNITITNGAGAITVATDTVLAAGTYTPTVTALANLDAVTAYECQYLRVGNTVTVSGQVDADVTTAGSQAGLSISLPVASNFGAAGDCAGVSMNSDVASNSAAIYASAVNDYAIMEWIGVGAAVNRAFFFTFTYQVI